MTDAFDDGDGGDDSGDDDAAKDQPGGHGQQD